MAWINVRRNGSRLYRALGSADQATTAEPIQPAAGLREHKMIEVENHGPLIVATNYWRSEAAIDGKMYVSVNAGAIRLLLPPAFRPALNAMRAAQEVVLSRGPWPEAGGVEGVEVMFDDGSEAPWCAHLTPESFDMLPAEPPPGREWIISVWIEKKGKPHKSLERPCHWRRAPRLPWLKPWKI